MSEDHSGCQVCGRRDVGLKKDGTLRQHVHADQRGSSFMAPKSGRCEGAGKLPKRTQYGARFKPDGPVFAEASREKAAALIAEHGRGVLVAHDYVPGQHSDDEWYEVPS